MPYKDIEKQRAAGRAYVSKNKTSVYTRVVDHKVKIREWFEGIKQTFSCEQCGENHPACLDFHHVKDEDKYGCVSSMVHAGYCVKRIEAEIKKCMVLCSNCHRKLHYKDKSGNCKSIKHVRKNRLKRNDKKWK